MAQIRITLGFLEPTHREGEFGILAFNIRIYTSKKKEKEEENGSSKEEITID